MSENRKLLEEIRKLEKIQSDLAATALRTDADRKQEMVQLRRQLSLQIGTISAEADAHYLQKAGQEDVRTFRALLSAMRRATALHQTNWPAVKLDELNQDFQESLKAVRVANNEFFAWVNANIKP